MKQTAVEWFFDELYEICKTISSEQQADAILKAFAKAKSMEKEQIIRTHLMARCYDTPNSYNEAEQYYNETFKSE